MAIAQRAPRTRFTAEMDERIQARQRSFARRRNRRRGDVEGAIDDLAEQMALPKGAVKGRWYALAAQRRQAGTIAAAEASSPPPAAAVTALRPPARQSVATPGTPRGRSLSSLMARYRRALAELDARQTELARAQAAAARAAKALAAGLRRR